MDSLFWIFFCPSYVNKMPFRFNLIIFRCYTLTIFLPNFPFLNLSALLILYIPPPQIVRISPIFISLYPNLNMPRHPGFSVLVIIGFHSQGSKIALNSCCFSFESFPLCWHRFSYTSMLFLSTVILPLAALSVCLQKKHEIPGLTLARPPAELYCTFGIWNFNE